MSASEDSVFTRPFQSMLFDVVRAHAPYCYRCPLGLVRPTCATGCAGAGLEPASPGTLGAVLAARGDSVAAVLVEPMLQAAGGMIVWPAEFLAAVRSLCDRHGVLMIADEVLTGFGRTGRMFACEHAAVAPDILCLSKAITGGYLPLGATLTTDAVYEAFLSRDRTRTFFHGHSFTGNPLACAVALASLDLLQETGALKKVAALETWLRDGLEPLRALPSVGDVRVIGGVGVVELVSDKTSKAAGGYLDQVGPRLTRALLDRGLMMRPLGHVLYLMPPYVITEQETAWAIQQVEAVVSALA
jgi:adenosylmethionine-8-amino-7-oxononanoate aminotransferase